jgi:hypothetical protein
MTFSLQHKAHLSLVPTFWDSSPYISGLFHPVPSILWSLPPPTTVTAIRSDAPAGYPCWHDQEVRSGPVF